MEARGLRSAAEQAATIEPGPVGPLVKPPGYNALARSAPSPGRQMVPGLWQRDPRAIQDRGSPLIFGVRSCVAARLLRRMDAVPKVLKFFLVGGAVGYWKYHRYPQVFL